MPAIAENLRELHRLHQRAKALSDRLISGPKTLGARQTALANRRAALENARKALQDQKVQLKKREHLLQSLQDKIDDLKGKLNQVRKNEEYKALQNQIAHDRAALGKLEDEILEAYSQIEIQTTELATLEADVTAFADEVAALQAQIDSHAGAAQPQLQELEAAIVEAEAIIPEDLRDRYRRTVKQRGADAMASVENGACSGCFTSVTSQMINELINADALCFCMSCGRILYLAEEGVPNSQRRAR